MVLRANGLGCPLRKTLRTALRIRLGRVRFLLRRTLGRLRQIRLSLPERVWFRLNRGSFVTGPVESGARPSLAPISTDCASVSFPIPRTYRAYCARSGVCRACTAFSQDAVERRNNQSNSPLPPDRKDRSRAAFRLNNCLGEFCDDRRHTRWTPNTIQPDPTFSAFPAPWCYQAMTSVVRNATGCAALRFRLRLGSSIQCRGARKPGTCSRGLLRILTAFDGYSSPQRQIRPVGHVPTVDVCGHRPRPSRARRPPARR